MKKKWIFILALAGLFAMTGACGNKKEENSQEGTASTEDEFSDSKVVKLGKYKGVEVKAVSTEVTEEDIQAEIDSLLAAYPDTKPIEDKTVVENGDTVNIDYVGRLDGEPFAGGSTQEGGTNLTIGSHSYIEGFEEGLIGKEVGNTYDLPLTFPDPYDPNPDLSGKEVVFEVTINEIVEFVDAEWNDEFVQKNTGYDSIDAFRESTKESLRMEKIQNAQEEKEYNIIQAIIDDTEFDCAESDLEALRNNTVQEYETYASFAGMELKDFLLYYNNMSEEEFEKQVADLAEFQLKSRLAIDAVSEAESIALTEEEYQEKLKELSVQYGAGSPEEFEKTYGRQLIEADLIYDKTIDFVVENAVEI